MIIKNRNQVKIKINIPVNIIGSTKATQNQLELTVNFTALKINLILS